MSPKANKFEVPKQVAIEATNESQIPETELAGSETFSIPDKVILESGIETGDTSDASELLVGKTETPPTIFEEETPEESAESKRASRNFSFTSGETSHIFDQLSKGKQRKALDLREKLIEKYKGQDVNERTIGLLCVNSIHKSLQRSGLVITSGTFESHDQYYLAHLGKPLDNDPAKVKEQQAKNPYIRRFGLKLPVENLRDTNASDYMLLERRMGQHMLYWVRFLPPRGPYWSPTVRLR